MSIKKAFLTALILATVTLVGCGGSEKAGPAEIPKDLNKPLPPPPSTGGGGTKTPANPSTTAE